MKKTIICVLLCMTMAGLSPAQNQGSSDNAAGQETTGRRPLDPDRLVQILGEKLQLTDDQKAKIQPVIVERQEKLRQLQADTSTRRLKKGRELKDILHDSDKKINAVLTPEQRTQYAQLKEQLRERIQEQRQNKSTP